ncbi:ArsC/Spx/MgsR family protein [Fretibacter rubidus]|uniref:ArsC/Spx/MgsR family protein n=1 Tax=Fretibacter rubidus TaxID=570162 RepID=UPI00352B5F0F
MTTLTVYHLKTCDTCRKAVKALLNSHDLTLVDVRADGVSEAVLKDIAASVGWEALLNTRSTTWRGLDDSEKTDMSEAKAVTLMITHPTLIKRPVITDGTDITVGWKAPQQERWL